MQTPMRLPCMSSSASMSPPGDEATARGVRPMASAADVGQAQAHPADAALVQRCLGGDGSAWAMLVQRYQRLVYAIVRRIGLDDHLAADVFQTVFSRLVEHLPRLADPSRLQAWIVTTAKREALQQRRAGRRSVSMTCADDGSADGAEWEVADDAPIAEEALADLQQLNRLRNALERLDERCRTLLKLLFRDEDDALSYEEVAHRLATSVGSIGPTRSRCLDKLRRLVV
jgi:RNA polymerase sigma factor (sigma-70 family)